MSGNITSPEDFVYEANTDPILSQQL